MYNIDKALNEIDITQQHPSERLRERTRLLVSEEVRKKKDFRKQGKPFWLLPVAAVVLAAFLILFTLPLSAEEVSYYTVDINPSISIQVNAQEIVMSLSAENEDAETLLQGMKLTGLTFEEALKAIVEAADEQGYLKDKGHVLVAHFGDTAGLTEQQIESAVSGSTQREVKTLMLQSSKETYVQAKAHHLKPGIELLKKQAADMGIEEQDVDAIIKHMRGNSPEKTNSQDESNLREEADSQPTATSEKQNTNDNSTGNSEKPQSHQTEGNQNGDDGNESSDNASVAQDKPNNMGSSDNSGNDNQSDNGSQSSHDNNGEEKNSSQESSNLEDDNLSEKVNQSKTSH